MLRLLLLAAGSLLLVLPSPTSARTWHITPDGTGDAPTIAAAFAMAAFGDEISLGSGTYYEHDILMKSSVDLYGEAGDRSAGVYVIAPFKNPSAALEVLG